MRCASGTFRRAVWHVPLIHDAALCGFESLWREAGAAGILGMHLRAEAGVLDLVAVILYEVGRVSEIALAERGIFDQRRQLDHRAIVVHSPQPPWLCHRGNLRGGCR